MLVVVTALPLCFLQGTLVCCYSTFWLFEVLECLFLGLRGDSPSIASAFGVFGLAFVGRKALKVSLFTIFSWAVTLPL